LKLFVDLLLHRNSDTRDGPGTPGTGKPRNGSTL
jgi:hypothetical protein